MQAVMIAAPHKSSGKTMIALGLARLLHRRGLRVQMFKKGPDYIDPIWHRHATGRPSYNLDFNTQSPDEIRQLFSLKSADADVVIVEGNHGLFDGQDVEGSDSNAALARLLGIPVLLVVDVTGFTRGLAPLLQGYAGFEPELAFSGVILNKCASAQHEQRLKGVCRRYAPMTLRALLPRQADTPVPERHLGLRPANEDPHTEQVIHSFAEMLQQRMDVDEWLSDLPRCILKTGTAAEKSSRPQGKRIAIFEDRAFGFYYPDDLERFEQLGYEICRVDTLQEERLPPVDGLFIGGGFPEMLAPPLSSNTALRRDLLRALRGGMPCYAECAGLMYLTEAIVVEGQRWPMVGFLPGETVIRKRPVGRGLMRLEAVQDHPWGWQSGQGVVHAHEFHHSEWVNAGGNNRYAWQVRRGRGLDGRFDGVVQDRTVAGYAHLRHTWQSPWVDRFTRYIEEQIG